MWTAEDRRAARKAGVLPPLPEPDVDPAAKLLAEQAGPAVAWSGGLYDDTASREAERRRRVANEGLEQHGARPRSTW